MHFKMTRTAYAVLCALAAQSTQLSATELQAIEVEADAEGPAGTVLEGEQRTPGRELAELLRDLPGVSGSRIGGHGTDPSIRGQAQTRINVLLDGAYLHGGCPNRMDPPTSYAAGFDELTLIRGVQTLEHGAGGPGGTLLLERNTRRFAGEERLRGRAEAGYRGNLDAREASVDVAAGSPQGFARLIGGRIVAGNYEDGGGNPVRASYRQRSGELIAGWTPNAGQRIELGYSRQRTRDLLFPGAGMDSPLADSDSLRLKARSDGPLGPLAGLRFELYRSDVEHVMDNYSLRPLSAPAAMRAPSTSDTRGGRLVAELDSELGRWKFGLDVQNNARQADRYNDTAGTLNSVLWPGVDIDQSGLFAELSHPLDSASRVTVGLRYDRVRSSADRADVDPPGGPLSPNALYAIYYGGAQASERTDHNLGGLLRYQRDIANGSWYASLSRSVRNADATERYIASNGSTASARWVGNPNIAPEKHHQLELGLNRAGDNWQAGASLYYNRVDDYILRDRFIASNNNATIYRNVRAALLGGEATLNYRFNRSWHSTLSLAYVRAHNESDDRPIAQTPPLELTASLDWSGGDWDAGTRLRAAARQTRVDTTSQTGIDGQGLDLQQTPGWVVIDLYGQYQPTRRLSLSFGVDNLFDRDYAQHLNRANAFDPTQIQVNEPGRSAWLKLGLVF